MILTIMKTTDWNIENVFNLFEFPCVCGRGRWSGSAGNLNLQRQKKLKLGGMSKIGLLEVYVLFEI